jgi:hypothetical protein
VIDGLWQESAMNRLANSSTDPEQRNMASSPSGVSVSGDPKRAVDQLDKLLPHWSASIELQTVKP